MVDPTGVEPATSSVQTRRSSQLSYGPLILKTYRFLDVKYAPSCATHTLQRSNRFVKPSERHTPCTRIWYRACVLQPTPFRVGKCRLRLINFLVKKSLKRFQKNNTIIGCFCKECPFFAKNS